MTDQELIDYYADLLIIQYRQKPKAFATMQGLVTPLIMNQLPSQVREAYTLGSAVGVQLDVLGKYAGVTRNGFGLDGHAITLDDPNFTKFIQLAIVLNHSDARLSTIQNLLHLFFPGEIFVFDYQDMRISYYLDPAVGSDDLAEMFVTSGLLPRPLAVQLGTTVISPHIYSYFGFRTTLRPTHTASPFNTVSDYHMDYPWLTVADGISP